MFLIQPTHKSHSFRKSDYTGHSVCYWFTENNQHIMSHLIVRESLYNTLKNTGLKTTQIGLFI